MINTVFISVEHRQSQQQHNLILSIFGLNKPRVKLKCNLGFTDVFVNPVVERLTEVWKQHFLLMALQSTWILSICPTFQTRKTDA